MQLYFGADASDYSGDWGAGDRGQDRYGGVSGQDAYRASPCWFAEVGPNDIVSGYHGGAVAAASRRAD
ncbi:MAG: hypothetical protein V9F03_05535 [Microthrixaceae bacterium]